MQVPKLVIGQTVEVKTTTSYTIRVYLSNESAIKDVESMLKSGDKLTKVWNAEGK